VENKEDLVTIVCGASASMVLDLLAVVLRREYSHGTGLHIVGVRNLKDMTNAIVVQNGPLDCTNSGIAGGAIETFDADAGLLGWSHKINEVDGDTGSSASIHQDVIRVRVKDGAVSGGRGSIVTMRLGTSDPHGDCRVGHQYVSAAAWTGFGPAVWSVFAMNRPLRRAKEALVMLPLNVDEGSQVHSHVVERVIGVFEPRLKPLRTRRELAFRDIPIGHGFNESSVKT
jgi:hypothetical protein